MPLIGLGTFPMNGWRLAITIRKAVKLGYRSFDTASAYQNEKWVGRGIRFSKANRSDLFITSKLSNSEQAIGDVPKALTNSLNRMGLDYLDLYLMHWPNPGTFIDSWKQMEKLYEAGLVRAIGVCNFHTHHLEELLNSVKIVPMVNQIELHPLLTQIQLSHFCKKRKIQIEAYSPLARMNPELIHHENLKNLARVHNKTITQIILRWNYQKDIVTVPKTKNANRLLENFSIENFKLSEADMTSINEINRNLRVRHDPDNCDFSKL